MRDVGTSVLMVGAVSDGKRRERQRASGGQLEDGRSGEDMAWEK